MKKFLSSIIIVGLAIGAYCNLRTIKNFIIQSDLTRYYVTYFLDGPHIDDDHVLTKLDNNMPIIVNIHDRCVCWTTRLLGYWDRNETKVIEKIVRPGFKIIEVGSNYGVHTIRMAKLVGDKGKIYAFEANPYVSKYLIQTIKLNKLHNINLYEMAVADKSYDGIMTYANSNIGAGYIYPEHVNTEQICQVQKCAPIKVTTIDQQFFDQKIDMLKIDAEGAEPWILSGAKNLLNNNPDIIIMMEWVPEHLKRNNINIHNFVKKLQDMQYKLWKINVNRGIDEIQFEELYNDQPYDIIMAHHNIL